MSMSKQRKTALVRTLEVLTEELDVDPVLVHLQSKELLNESHVQAIKAKHTEREKIVELVTIIQKRGERAYHVFKEYLENCVGSKHLAEELDDNLKAIEEEHQELTAQSKKEVEKWKGFEEKFHYVRCEHECIDCYQNVTDNINILLIGKTGSGKSATGNTIIGTPCFKESGPSVSVTKKIATETFKEGRFNITVIDTPGFLDTATPDLQNENLLLEITKAIINFEKDIHLFLLVWTPTTAQQNIIETIEEVLTKDVYNNLVVIVTNARAQFGGRTKISLKTYVDQEKENGGKDADLLFRVNNKIIAVENCFDEDFLITKHRCKLLCCLAQIIEKNNGAVYSNKSFVSAKMRIEQQEADRKKGIAKEKELAEMISILRVYLVHTYLTNPSEHQLDNMPSILETDIMDIMEHSHVTEKLPLITEKDVEEYLPLFIEEHKTQITEINKKLEEWNTFKRKVYYRANDYESIDQYPNIPDEINILLIGKTGSGKSATGNTIIGKSHFKASGSSESVTKTINMEEIKEGRINIRVIDTPGLFDTDVQITNKELMLEIAKTMITFKGGVHLFLLVCNSGMRFTNEEQETIKEIEKVLSKELYSNCALLLTRARSTFVDDPNMNSLEDYVNTETNCGREFSYLLSQVKYRIIPVENFFVEEYLIKKHRQKLLCSIAQIIKENDGSMYSNKLFEKAKERVEKQEAKRKDRVVTKMQELTMMRNELRKYLVQLLSTLSGEELDNINATLEYKMADIMLYSGVKQLALITKKDVLAYLEYFMQEDGILIAKWKDLNMHRSKQREDEQTKREELEKTNDMILMQIKVVAFLNNQSKQQVENLLQFKNLHDYDMNELIESLELSNVNCEKKQIEQYISETVVKCFTENDTNIDERLAQLCMQNSQQLELLQKKQHIQNTIEMLNKQIPKFMEHASDDLLQLLSSDLENMESSDHAANWKPLFNWLSENDIEDSDINMNEIFTSYSNINCNLLQSNLWAILEKRRKPVAEGEAWEGLRISAFCKISEVIKEKLKSYIIQKTRNELKTLDAQIRNGTVPDEIFDKVYEHLSVTQKGFLTRDEITAEILAQIIQHSQVIEECKQLAAECFAGSTEVRIKDGDICKMSDVKVDDKILVFDENGHLFYDKVYLISHANEDENITFVRLQTSSGKELYISAGHLLPVGNLCSNVTAKEVSLGDVIFTLQDGVMTSDIVTSISCELCRGAYCPMTMNGTIVVNDVATSCYTSFFPSRLSHALLSPIRLLFSYLPLPLFHMLLPYDDEEGMPIMFLKCRSMIITWRSFIGNYNFCRN